MKDFCETKQNLIKLYKMNTFYVKQKEMLRAHSDLNQGPIDLQSIALPLSYTPLLRKAEKTLQQNPHYAMYAEQANRVETLVLHLHNCFKNKCFYVLPSIFLSCHMTSCQKFLQLYKKM